MIDDLFKMNCSTIFLLHPLGLSRTKMDRTGFLNCYLRDPEHPYEGMQVLYLLFKPGVKFKYFVDTEKERTKLFIDEYDLEDGFVVLVYEFPPELSRDYELFLKGSYSLFSKEFKATIPKYTRNGYKELSFQYMVVNRHPEWKAYLEGEEGLNMPISEELEYWMMPNMEKETIIQSQLKQMYEDTTVSGTTGEMSESR
jgi:hypothetical protein